VQQHDGIGAALAHITTGAQFSLLFLAEALAGVRTDEQPIGAGGIRDLFFWQGLDTGESGIGPEHEDEVEYQQNNERQADATEGALGRINLLAAAMRALTGHWARLSAARWALLRAVLAGIAARRWRWGAAARRLWWLGSTKGLLLRFDAARGLAGGGTAANGAAVSILEGTSISPKDEFSGGAIAGAAGFPMWISS